ncbi:vitamin B12 dependent-methionine synthase activation domain-containing protein [Absicoccus intestinalis]|uniref:AdoMet activation domain-containing protein n=1 Tax=Absicoccus intestinalis TaxID=2926319 RepID=A0ABU4WJN1_9FIRM|nr:vitamin B12 dependent-methionine synthase activation domain-containing protein [Absicoccus sp. CLA-KB-P134]MDX8416767.1 hypothetical protein [Absicoccus sp. CLA-KB-P134]
MIELKNSEIQRYLGYQKIQPDKQINTLIERCKKNVIHRSTPRKSVRVFPLIFQEDTLVIETMHIQSKSLYRNLAGCDKVCLMGVTIGPAIDQLIRRAEISHMVEVAIYQAIGAAYAEAWADTVNQEIKETMLGQGYYCRPRFSPGYGDFDLSFQTQFSQLLDLPHTTGITLTDTLLMMPSKSVTALIGCSTKEEPCILAGCEVCEKTNCSFRRNTQ